MEQISREHTTLSSYLAELEKHNSRFDGEIFCCNRHVLSKNHFSIYPILLNVYLHKIIRHILNFKCMQKWKTTIFEGYDNMHSWRQYAIGDLRSEAILSRSYK